MLNRIQTTDFYIKNKYNNQNSNIRNMYQQNFTGGADIYMKARRAITPRFSAAKDTLIKKLENKVSELLDVIALKTTENNILKEKLAAANKRIAEMEKQHNKELQEITEAMFKDADKLKVSPKSAKPLKAITAKQYINASELIIRDFSKTEKAFIDIFTSQEDNISFSTIQKYRTRLDTIFGHDATGEVASNVLVKKLLSNEAAFNKIYPLGSDRVQNVKTWTFAKTAVNALKKIPEFKDVGLPEPIVDNIVEIVQYFGKNFDDIVLDPADVRTFVQTAFRTK